MKIARELFHIGLARLISHMSLRELKNGCQVGRFSPTIPQCNEDWSGMAEVSFWLGYFGIPWSFYERIPYLELERAIEYLPLEILADLILGLNHGYRKDFATWRTSNRSKIVNRFREETLTVDFQDDENKVTAHFVIEIERLIDSNIDDCDLEESSNYLHDEAMRRINLLRRLLPDRNILCLSRLRSEIMERSRFHLMTHRK